MIQGIGLVEKYNNEANLILRWNFNRHRKYYQWLIYRELLFRNKEQNRNNTATN
jgi:hypothetical protein